LEIRTSKGLDTGSYFGGQGGISRIRITLEKNIEYTVLGISNNSGLFIYRGSTLIAAVGKGGDAGSLGNGGAGGGMNDSGGSGSGRNSGFGGVRPSAGELTTNGIFGSNSTITTFLPGDSKATIPNGGRTISCPKGSYWVDVRGVPPCSNIGFSQFYNTNQTLIPQSSLINRGFKPGYTITSTEGARISNGGNGGTGATGGSGGDGGGGGGGSGYTNNSYTVLSSSFGGNNSLKSTINFKVFVPPPHWRNKWNYRFRWCTESITATQPMVWWQLSSQLHQRKQQLFKTMVVEWSLCTLDRGTTDASRGLVPHLEETLIFE
jgi:hypothetical protein